MSKSLFKYGMCIGRHYLKGVYVLALGKSKSQPSESSAETQIICSIREGRYELEAWDQQEDNDEETDDLKYKPIEFFYQGTIVTVRPWDPYSCVIAAGIHNRLVHFPIRPGFRIFAFGCPLQTLSHIADAVGPSGHIVGVLNQEQSELQRFSRKHPNVSALCGDPQSATLQNYERQLSIPQENKYALLMGLHPRLGENSPVHVLKDVPARDKLFNKIFEFLDFPDVAKVKCLVMCHCPPNTTEESIRDVVLSHIEIVQNWGRKDEVAKDKKKNDKNDRASSNSSAEEAGDTSGVPGVDTKEKVPKKSKANKTEAETESLWILLDLPTDNIVADPNNPSSDVNSKITHVAHCLKRINGLRTGVFAKEQLLLRPYYVNHALLLLKYVATRDERKHGVMWRDKPSSTEKTASGEVAAPEGAPSPPDANKDRKSGRPPSSSTIPLPSFMGGGAAPSFPAPPAPAAPAPHAVARTPGPVGPVSAVEPPHPAHDDGRPGSQHIAPLPGRVPGQSSAPAMSQQQKKKQVKQPNPVGYDRNPGGATGMSSAFHELPIRLPGNEPDDFYANSQLALPVRDAMDGSSWWPTEALGVDPTNAPPLPPPPPGFIGGSGMPTPMGGGFGDAPPAGPPGFAPVSLGNQWSGYQGMHGGSQHGMGKGNAGMHQRRQPQLANHAYPSDQMHYMHQVSLSGYGETIPM